MRPQNQMVCLKDVATFMGGGTPSRVSAKYFGGDIPWVKTTDLNNGQISRTEESLTPLGLKNSSCKMIPRGAVLVAMYGGFRQIGRTGLLMRDCAINQALTAILPDENHLDPLFLQEWLNHRVGYWKRFAGSSRKDPNITKTDVADFPVPLIPLTVQRSAVKLISDWSQAIKLVEQLVEKKAQMLTVSSAKASGQDLFSESDYVRADELFTPTNEQRRPDLPVLAVTQDRGVIPRSLLDRRILMESSDPATFKVVRVGDFVISLRSFEGGIEYSAYEGLVSPAYIVLRPDARVHAPFYRHYLRSQDFLRRLSVAVVGIRDGKQISFPDFASIKLPLPTAKRQQQLAKVFDDAEAELEAHRRYLAALKAQKRGLMQKLLTGEWSLLTKESKAA